MKVSWPRSFAAIGLYACLRTNTYSTLAAPTLDNDDPENEEEKNDDDNTSGGNDGPVITNEIGEEVEEDASTSPDDNEGIEDGATVNPDDPESPDKESSTNQDPVNDPDKEASDDQDDPEAEQNQDPDEAESGEASIADAGQGDTDNEGGNDIEPENTSAAKIPGDIDNNDGDEVELEESAADVSGDQFSGSDRIACPEQDPDNVAEVADGADGAEENAEDTTVDDSAAKERGDGEEAPIIEATDETSEPETAMAGGTNQNNHQNAEAKEESPKED